MKDTIVFAGPSISQDEILSVLPNAMIHEPVRCQDVYRAIRLNPKRMIIIDGYYETGLSVWHKEILAALACGIEVIGAASMGALRAAELSHFGMIGIGQIFDWYQQGVIDGDDEVAILHGDAAMGYLSTNLALVEIRATINQLLKEQLISKEQYELILTNSQKLFYPYRKNYQSILDPNTPSRETLLDLLNKHHVPLKKQDAIKALQYAKTHPPKTAKNAVPVHLTLYFTKLCMEANTSTFNRKYEWLPESEKKSIDWLLSKKRHIQLVKEYARGLNHAYRVLITEQSPKKDYWQQTLNWVAIKKQDNIIHPKLQLFFEVYFYKSHVSDDAIKTIISKFIDVLLILVRIMDEKNFHIAGVDANQFRDFILKKRLSIERPEDLNQFIEQYHINEAELNECMNTLIRYYIGYKSLHMIPTENIHPIPSQNWLYPVLSLF